MVRDSFDGRELWDGPKVWALDPPITAAAGAVELELKSQEHVFYVPCVLKSHKTAQTTVVEVISVGFCTYLSSYITYTHTGFSMISGFRAPELPTRTRRT